MKKYLWLAACAAMAMTLASCGSDPEPPATEEPKQLDAADVAARLEAGEDIFLLDVRTPEEITQDGAIEGYTHIPIDELEGRLAEVPTDKPIVAY